VIQDPVIEYLELCWERCGDCAACRGGVCSALARRYHTLGNEAKSAAYHSAAAWFGKLSPGQCWNVPCADHNRREES
jgi:hypothetical protein